MSQARQRNYGEGNPEADRVYREGLQKFVRSNKVDQKAREAAKSVGKQPVGRTRARKKK
jgi:hypothetical protein